MGFLDEYCTFSLLSKDILLNCETFDCGHADMNDFFLNDSENYSKELLGKSYCFLLDDQPNTVVCAFTLSNDSIKANFLPQSRKQKITKKIPSQKRFKSYPALLIGRLGVNKNFHHKGIGDELMNFIKSWFIDINNKTGCRFIVVDSYNSRIPINYYQRNKFQFLFSTEDQEKNYAGLSSGSELKTRLMYFDLIVLSANT